jgi:hypothetical protein
MSWTFSFSHPQIRHRGSYHPYIFFLPLLFHSSISLLCLAENKKLIELTEDEVKELYNIDKTHHFRACHPNWTGWGSLGFPDCAEEGSKFI